MAARSSRRWLALVVIAIAQLMVVLDISIVNIALPSAQSALHFSVTDRQWVVTAYALSFGSLLLFGGKLGDLFGRKLTFIVGLIGFAAVSAIGGASTGFVMLVTARACQGAFGALLAPAALSLLTTMFSDPRERGKAFGVFGAVAVGGGAVGLLLGGLLTEYLSWRWTLYVNLFFAVIAAVGAVALLPREPRRGWTGLDVSGVLLGGGSMFCLVYGFSNASAHSWSTPSTYVFLAAGAGLLILFVVREALAHTPLLPLRILGDRDRAGSNVAVLCASAGMFGIFLFLTYYMQQTLHYSPVMTGIAFLPMVGMIMVFSNIANIVLLPRIGAKPLVFFGLAAAASGMAWLTRIGVHTTYAEAVLGPLLVMGPGLGLAMASSMNTGTFGVAATEAGVASACLNTGQQIGGSIGTSLLNTMATTSTSRYLTAHLGAVRAAHPVGGASAVKALTGLAVVHGYSTAFWWAAGIFGGGALVSGALLRLGRPAQHAVSPVTDTTTNAPAATAPARHGIDGHGADGHGTGGHGTGGHGTGGALVYGYVRQSGGTPLGGATVTLIGPDGRQAAGARTDPDGKFAVAPPGGGFFTLTAMAASHRPSASLVNVTGRPVEVDMRLAGLNGLGGVVRTARTHSPVGGAMVTLADSSGTVVAVSRVGDTGRFRFEALPAADYTLIASAPFCSPTALTVTVPADAEASADPELRVAGTLTGTVRTGSGLPVADARVTLADQSGDVVGTAVTGADGEYALADIPDGEYTLTARSHPPTAATVRITAGPSQGHDLEMVYQDGT